MTRIRPSDGDMGWQKTKSTTRGPRIVDILIPKFWRTSTARRECETQEEVDYFRGRLGARGDERAHSGR